MGKFQIDATIFHWILFLFFMVMTFSTTLSFFIERADVLSGAEVFIACPAMRHAGTTSLCQLIGIKLIRLTLLYIKRN